MLERGVLGVGGIKFSANFGYIGKAGGFRRNSEELKIDPGNLLIYKKVLGDY